jgi:hypothetical protein
LAAEEGLENEEQIRENRQAIRQLTKTIDHLLNKLDKTEQGNFIIEIIPHHILSLNIFILA